MKTREWLDSITVEQKASILRLGGMTFQICMSLLKENSFRIGVQSRYGFVANMTNIPFMRQVQC